LFRQSRQKAAGANRLRPPASQTVNAGTFGAAIGSFRHGDRTPMEATMQTISGLFDSYDEARGAVHALEDAGIASDAISVVSLQASTTALPSDTRTAEGIGLGAAVGGLLAGLAAFSIVGIGSVVGAGWLATTLLGAAAGGIAGGLIGSLTSAGITERDAHVYAEGLKRGGTLVTARVEKAHACTVRAILVRHNAVDTEARRSAYEADAWEGFAEKDIWDADIGNEDRPARERLTANSR
jgi:hypothetical protein